MKLTKGQLKEIIREELSNMNEVDDEFTNQTLVHLKTLANKRNLNIKNSYWNWFVKTKDFEKMISTEKLNRRNPIQAAKSIIKIWD